MAEVKEKIVNFSEINFPKFQQKIEPLKDKNLFEPYSSLKKYDRSNLTKTEKIVLDLFEKILSIRLSDDFSHPFVPLFQSANGEYRTCMPEDITDEEMDFFISILDYVVNDMLKARIADILWFRKYNKKAGILYPEIVIDKYLSIIDFNASDFFAKLPYWKRGLSLATQINKKDSLECFGQNVLDYLFKTKFNTNDSVLELIKLLRIFKLCKEQKNAIIKKAVECGDELKNKYCCLAEIYYDEASLWADSQKQSDEFVKLQMKRVEVYIQEAKKSKSGSKAATCYETALKILRSLDGAKREQYFSTEEENELIRNIKSSGKFALSEMKEKDFFFDISKLTEDIIDKIKGLDLSLALTNFATQFGQISLKNLEENAINLLKMFPWPSIIGSTAYANDGRVVARTPGMNDFNNLSLENPSVWQNMILQYKIHINLIVQGKILPALQIIYCEHDIQLNYIVRIVQKSNLIPKDRVEVFAKGLYAGFSYDFITALNLLVPQVEHLVRHQLQEAEAITSNISNKKDREVENENCLSTLVKNAKFENIFGKDLGFEIKALFCDGAGPNLRNNIAHGLFSSDEMKGLYSIYCWWFCFKLVNIGFYNTERNEVKLNKQEETCQYKS